MFKCLISKLNLTLVVMAIGVSACSSSVPQGAKQTDNNGYVIKDVLISVPAYVPVFSGTSTFAGIFLFNNNKDVKISSISVSDATSSASISTTRRVMSLIKSVSPTIARVFSSGYSSTSGFTLDSASVSSCITELNKGKGNQCLLNFTTPVVQDTSENGSVIITVTTTKNKSYQQIISWDSIPRSAKIPSYSYFNSMPYPVASGDYATMYVYVGAESAFVGGNPTLTAGAQQSGTAIVSTVYSLGTYQTTNGAIIPMLVQPIVVVDESSVTAMVKPKATKDVSLFSYLTLPDGSTTPQSTISLTVLSANSANIVASNIPTLFTVESGQHLNSSIVKVINTGSVAATDFKIVTDGPVTTSDNTCTDTLDVGAYCNYTIKAESSTQITTLATVSYTFVSKIGGSVTVQDTKFYVENNKSGGPMVVFTNPGSQVMAVNHGLANESATFNIGISNLGGQESAVDLILSAFIDGNSATITNSTTTCSDILAPDDDCSITVTITSTQTPGSGNFVESISYRGESQFVVPTRSSVLVPYQVVADPFLSLLPSNTYTMSSTGLSTTPILQTVTVKNTGSGAGYVDSVQFNPNSSYMTMSSDTCTNHTLDVNESCYFVMTLTPPSTPLSATESGIESVLVVYSSGAYRDRAITYNPSLVTFNWLIQGATSSDMTLAITNVTATPAASSGTGVAASPFNFAGHSATNSQQITITYQNTSMFFSAESLLFNSSSLPSLYSVDPSSTCGYVSSSAGAVYKSAILAQATCNLVLNIDRTALPFYSSAGGVVTMPLPYPQASWNSAGTDMVQSDFSYLSEPSLSVNYVIAALNTSITNNNTDWSISPVVTQTLTNATGYSPLSVTDTYWAPLDNIINITGLINAIQSSNVITSTLSSSTGSASWTMSANTLAIGSESFANQLGISGSASLDPLKVSPANIYITRH